jgi:acetyltransferase-like isoleucine patch superfamily enzyme
MTKEPKQGWTDGSLPVNARVGAQTRITGDYAFKRFLSGRSDGLVIGDYCTMEGVPFAVGQNGRIVVGNYCYFASAILVCEQELRFGNYVLIGWNATIADSDFHPLDPAQRIADVVACSPLCQGRTRPEIQAKAVIIEDNVWIGPNATILKGVRVGAGAVIEAGSLITRDVPPGARMLGNPARPCA